MAESRCYAASALTGELNVHYEVEEDRAFSYLWVSKVQRGIFLQPGLNVWMCKIRG
jgi:hypothetical protein